MSGTGAKLEILESGLVDYEANADLLAVPADGVMRVIGTTSVASLLTFFIEAQFLARAPATGDGATQRIRASVKGGAAPVVLQIADVFGIATNIGAPPVFTLALAGTNIEARVTNPVTGQVVNVRVLFDPRAFA